MKHYIFSHLSPVSLALYCIYRHLLLVFFHSLALPYCSLKYFAESMNALKDTLEVGADGKYQKKGGRNDWQTRKGAAKPAITHRQMWPSPVSHKVRFNIIFQSRKRLYNHKCPSVRQSVCHKAKPTNSLKSIIPPTNLNITFTTTLSTTFTTTFITATTIKMSTYPSVIKQNPQTA